MKNKGVVTAIIVLIIVAAGVAIVVGASGKKSTDSMKMSDSSSGATDNSKPVATNTVAIKSYAFGPAAITVKVGTKVTWTNMDAVGHTITADTPSSDAPNSELFNQGGTYSFTFTKAGTYAYHCVPHPYMKGTVTVTN